MNRTLLIAFFAWLLSAAAIHARADDLDTARKAIEAQYARLDAATARKDPSPFEPLATPDFRYVRASGDEFDLVQSTSLWQQNLVAFEALQARTAVESVALEGETAHAIARSALEGTLKQGDSSVKFRNEGRAHDTWVKIRTEWRLHRSTAITSKTWINDDLVEDLTAKAPLPPAARDAIVAELRARAIPVKTVMAGAGFDDLAALDQIIGDARIVALGEATHGTAEFFRMKHRLFEYLVEKKGFTVFAFEDHWPDLEIVDRYIKTGEGDAARALRAMYHWVWRTQEVRDLIEWMRAYNSVPGRRKRLSFTGFDMQIPQAAANCVIDAFTRLGASEAESIRRRYAGMLSKNPLSEDEKAKLTTDVADALKFVESHREGLLQVLTPAEYRRVRQCAVVVVQGSFTGVKSEAEYGNARDRAMAENVKWLADDAFADEKIVLWAHNLHISADPSAPGFVSMGQHLRQAFGEQMRVLGFAFERGEVYAIPFKDGKHDIEGGPIVMKVPAARPNSADALLRATGLPRFILDLRAVPAGSPLGTWMAEPQRLRNFGWAYHPDAPSSTMILPKAFDALIFIEESSPTVPLQ